MQDFGNELEGSDFTKSILKVIFVGNKAIISLLNFSAIGRIQFWATLFLTSCFASPLRTETEEVMFCWVVPESFNTSKESPLASPKMVTDTFLLHCAVADAALVVISRNFFFSLDSILAASDFVLVKCSTVVK